MATFEVTQERVIRARRDALVAFATDPANDLAWIKSTRYVRVLTEGPVDVGDRIERRAGLLGWRFDYVLQVVDRDPGHRVVMRAVAGPFPVVVRYEFEDAQSGTLMRISVAGEVEASRRWIGTIVSSLARILLARSLRALEDRLLNW